MLLRVNDRLVLFWYEETLHGYKIPIFIGGIVCFTTFEFLISQYDVFAVL
jgi:hypothetical protein